MPRSRLVSTCLVLLTLLIPAQSFAQDGSFSDVPPDHPSFTAIEELRKLGVLTGYDDGTFRPHKKVNRAEAVKIIVSAFISADEYKSALEQTSTFTDIPKGTWYLPYVEFAREAGVIDGPPAKTRFLGEQPVLLVEFLKILMGGSRGDPNSYSEIRLPVSADVSNVNEWYYPYIRYGIATSMLVPDTEGLFHPGKELTRGETAVLIHRYILYGERKQTETLVKTVDENILQVLGNLEQNDIETAEYASARALLAARGALTSEPKMSLLQGTVKIVEAFRALVRAYRAALEKDYESTIQLAGDAWNLAIRAKEFNSDLNKVSAQVQETATEMADTARALQVTPQ